MKQELPYNLTILPGVWQMANGKLFRTGRYPSGKSVAVPYLATEGAEKGYSIPVVAEPEKKKPKLKVKNAGPDKRTHVVSYRRVKEAEFDARLFDRAIEANLLVDELRDLQRSPDCGATWIAATRISLEWCVQSIVEEQT